MQNRIQPWCLALLTPTGFARRKPLAGRQVWYLAVSLHEVTLRRDAESLQFSTANWQDDSRRHSLPRRSVGLLAMRVAVRVSAKRSAASGPAEAATWRDP